MSANQPRRFFWFPILPASYPPIYIASNNVGEFTAVELAIIVAIAAAAGAVVYGAVHLVLRRRGRPGATAVVAGLINAWLFVSIALADTLTRMGNVPLIAKTEILVPVTAAITLALSWLVLRGGADRGKVRRSSSIVAFALVGIATLQLLVSGARASRTVATSPFVKSRTAPLDPRPDAGAHSTDSLPDVYLIILDKYTSSNVLRDRLDFSNAAFDSSLRQLGFVTLPDGRSNYAFTWSSLASMLNMEHVALSRDSLRSAETLGLRYMIEHNRAVDLIKERGYRFFFFPSQWFVATRRDPRSDMSFAVRSSSPRVHASRSQLAHTVWMVSVPGRLAALFDYDLRNPEHEFVILEGVQTVAPEPGPKFILAHVMLTHEPFYYDRDCRIVSLLGRKGNDRQAYLDSIECANRMLLELVQAIVTRSPRPPVILLQGDHGVQAEWFVRKDGAREALQYDRFGAYAAYLLPDGGREALDTTITPVNLLRFVFSHYLRVRLDPRPNVSIWTEL